MGRDGQVSRRGLLASLSLLPALRLLPGQQNPTFSTDVKVVNVLATVRDKKGQIVRDLNKNDFLLDEDGRPQTIRYFAQESDLPLTLGLLVDVSPSQRRLVADERSASYDVLRPGVARGQGCGVRHPLRRGGGAAPGHYLFPPAAREGPGVAGRVRHSTEAAMGPARPRAGRRRGTPRRQGRAGRHGALRCDAAGLRSSSCGSRAAGRP